MYETRLANHMCNTFVLIVAMLYNEKFYLQTLYTIIYTFSRDFRLIDTHNKASIKSARYREKIYVKSQQF